MTVIILLKIVDLLLLEKTIEIVLTLTLPNVLQNALEKNIVIAM